MEQIIEITMAALIGALIAGAGAWVVFGSRFATKEEVSRKMEGVGKRIHEWGISVSQLERKAEHILNRDQVQEMVERTAPWTRDRTSVNKQLSDHEKRLDKIETAYQKASASLIQIEGMVKQLLGNK